MPLLRQRTQISAPVTNSSSNSSTCHYIYNNNNQAPAVTTMILTPDSLFKESKTLVKIITLVISKKMKLETELLKEELIKKASQITKLSGEIVGLKEKVQELETSIDGVDQYERRDTIIVSGPSLSDETPHENPSTVITNAFKDHLKLNISVWDINIAHRIGPANSQRKRPIIVKLCNRTLKHDLVGACIQMKPPLYINVSLTPKRLLLFKQVLNIRRSHRNKLQQCHTKDGKIIVRLRNSTIKHEIINQQTLITFLDKYPDMKIILVLLQCPHHNDLCHKSHSSSLQ